MASLLEKPGGRWSLQFRLRPRTERQTIALGAMTAAQARGFQERVEALVDAMRADSPPDPSTAKWVAGLSDDLHAKLARVGLITPRDNGEAAAATPLLGRFVENYIDKRKDVKARTKIIYGQVRGNLVAFFGATRPMNKITPGDCDDWRSWLESDQGLADNTIRRRCSAARQFFRAALRHKLIAENPFADMKGCSFVEVRDREYFVTRKQAQQVLDACPDAQWRLLFALARFGGLRVPSEPLGLRWQDVNWERERILIHSPKTEGKGKATRVIPLFPELRPFLKRCGSKPNPGRRGFSPDTGTDTPICEPSYTGSSARPAWSPGQSRGRTSDRRGRRNWPRHTPFTSFARGLATPKPSRPSTTYRRRRSISSGRQPASRRCKWRCKLPVQSGVRECRTFFHPTPKTSLMHGIAAVLPLLHTIHPFGEYAWQDSNLRPTV